jgi:hypothetical protein
MSEAVLSDFEFRENLHATVKIIVYQILCMTKYPYFPDLM